MTGPGDGALLSKTGSFYDEAGLGGALVPSQTSISLAGPVIRTRIEIKLGINSFPDYLGRSIDSLSRTARFATEAILRCLPDPRFYSRGAGSVVLRSGNGETVKLSKVIRIYWRFLSLRLKRAYSKLGLPKNLIDQLVPPERETERVFDLIYFDVHKRPRLTEKRPFYFVELPFIPTFSVYEYDFPAIARILGGIVRSAFVKGRINITHRRMPDMRDNPYFVAADGSKIGYSDAITRFHTAAKKRFEGVIDMGPFFGEQFRTWAYLKLVELGEVVQKAENEKTRTVDFWGLRERIRNGDSLALRLVVGLGIDHENLSRRAWNVLKDEVIPGLVKDMEEGKAESSAGAIVVLGNLLTFFPEVDGKMYKLLKDRIHSYDPQDIGLLAVDGSGLAVSALRVLVRFGNEEAFGKIVTAAEMMNDGAERFVRALINAVIED